AGPNGSTAQGSMPNGDTGAFASQVAFFFGVNPNGGPNIGKFLALSSINISITNSNATNSITSDFTTGAPLDASTWTILADDPASIIPMPSDAVFRVAWRNAVGAGVGPNSLIYTNALLGSGSWPAAPSGALLGDGTNVVFLTRRYT